MNVENMNNMVQYIEENLTNKIDNNELAKKVGLSFWQLQRIFTYITDMTITEYIRKRRLSMAYEDLKNTDLRVIDIAYKYQYESDIAFIRAFKNMFQVTPTECRKSTIEIQQYPVLRFGDTDTYNKYSYEVVELEKEIIYAFYIREENHDDFLYKIRELFKKISPVDKEMVADGLMGVSDCTYQYYGYYCGSFKKFFDEQVEYTVKAGRYLKFSGIKANQKEITTFIKNIYSQFLDSTSYQIDIDYLIEKYHDGLCDLYFLLK